MLSGNIKVNKFIKNINKTKSLIRSEKWKDQLHLKAHKIDCYFKPTDDLKIISITMCNITKYCNPHTEFSKSYIDHCNHILDDETILIMLPIEYLDCFFTDLSNWYQTQ